MPRSSPEPKRGTRKIDERPPQAPERPPDGERQMTPDELIHFERDIVQSEDNVDDAPPASPVPVRSPD